MMPPTKFLVFLILIVASCAVGYWFVKDKKPEFKRPHIVFIVADDMGWNDVSFHGSNQIPTPNIDALAYNGVILNKHYVLPTCTPSRTSLLTSRFAIREGMQGWPLKPGEPRGIPLSTTLMPEYFRKLGYSNHLVGKWHLGYASKNYTPTSRGFDSFFGYYNGLITYFNYTVRNSIGNSVPMAYDLHRDSPGNLTVAHDSKYFTDLITDEAEKIIKANGNEKPLFLTITHLAVHASEGSEYLEVRNFTQVNSTFSHIKDIDRLKYAGMMKAMDESVGRVVTALAETNMLENSIIVFISDNGAPTIGFYNNTGSNYPLRGLKHTLFEGGVRGAACIFSPLIKAASRVSYETMHIVDWLPTLYSAAGGNLSDIKGQIDGLNQWPSISRGTESPRKSLLVNIDSTGSEAAISGKHKLIKGYHEENKEYYGDNGTDPSNPTYQFKEILRSPAGSVIRRLFGFKSVSAKEAQKLRERSKVNCNKTRVPLNCSRVCLFDLKSDPCETQDLSIQLPTVVKELETLIDNYRNLSIPETNADLDPCSDPKYFNGTSMPWRTNDTLPLHVLSNVTCQHPIYKFFTS